MFLLACGFDSSGQATGGTGGETDSGTDGTGTTGTAGSTSTTGPMKPTAGTDGATSGGSSGPTSAGTTTDSGSTGGGTTGVTATTGAGTTTGGGSTSGDPTTGAGSTTADPCDGFTFTEVYPASDGTLEAPMEFYGDAQNSPGVWAQSQDADQGTITWDVDLECAAKVYLWAVVWDSQAGANGAGDADSFWVAVDGENPEWKWVYGCSTMQNGFSYQPVSHNEANSGCTVLDLDWDLTAGAHTVRLRNREGSDFQGAAAVARLLVTTDGGLVPDIQNY
jgi:hypothetical protein